MAGGCSYAKLCRHIFSSMVMTMSQQDVMLFVILQGRGKFGTIPSEAPQVHSWRGEHRRLDASLPEYRPSAIRRHGFLGGVSPGSTDLGAACEVERVNDPQHLRSSHGTVASELRLLSLSLSGMGVGQDPRASSPPASILQEQGSGV